MQQEKLLEKQSHFFEDYFNKVKTRIENDKLIISNYVLETYFNMVINKIARNKEYTILKNENKSIVCKQYFEEIQEMDTNLKFDEKKKPELDVVKDYCRFSSKNINDYLRGKPIYSTALKTTLNRIEKLVGVINKFQVKENILVIRRMQNSFLTKDYKKDGEFVEKGFLSASLNIDYKLNLGNNSNLLKNESLLLIKIPKKINALYVENESLHGQNKTKFEVILQRDYLMKVEYKRRIFSNNIIVLKALDKNVA